MVPSSKGGFRLSQYGHDSWAPVTLAGQVGLADGRT